MNKDINFKINPDSITMSHIFATVEISLEYSKWAQKIPFIPFKSDWLVKPIPPFGRAIVRFLVAKKDNPDKKVSVYLDCYNILGIYDYNNTDNPVPYWEVYPVEDDVERIKMEDVKELVNVIDFALNHL